MQEVIYTPAKTGDIIEFRKKGRKLNGKVLSTLQNSVVVELKQRENMELEFVRTVIGHKKYKIISNH